MVKRYTPIFIIAISILLVCAYQLYWLVGQYKDLKARTQDDIIEALRSADFEELAHRVDEISRMNFKGNVKVNMGYDHKTGNSLTRSQVKQLKEEKSPTETTEPEGTTTTVNAASFGNMLKTPDDLRNIGLNMQRGIHMSLDAIMDVNIDYLDQRISNKLNSLGLDTEHELIYIKTPADHPNTSTDTLAKIGSVAQQDTDSFSMAVSDGAEYRIVIANWRLAVLRKMMPVIIFSLLTLTLLIVSFVYLINVMRRQREMEEIKTDFTNNITHELKTPIAVAYAANDALLNHDAKNNTPRMNRYLQVCQEQLRLLDRLVEQILSVSMDRKKAVLLNMEDIDINEMLQSLAKTFKLKYPSSTLTVNVEEGLLLRSDYMHLSNIVGNLIDNAIKYSYSHAQVTLNARSKQPDGCIISVSDKGIGISESQQKLIFDRFYRVPHGNIHDVKGYGLGLFYVKSMTQRLGATVSVASSLGKGSTFTLHFSTHPQNGKHKDIID